jgi:hypothetical protein
VLSLSQGSHLSRRNALYSYKLHKSFIPSMIPCSSGLSFTFLKLMISAFQVIQKMISLVGSQGGSDRRDFGADSYNDDMPKGGLHPLLRTCTVVTGCKPVWPWATGLSLLPHRYSVSQ